MKKFVYLISVLIMLMPMLVVNRVDAEIVEINTSYKIEEAQALVKMLEMFEDEYWIKYKKSDHTFEFVRDTKAPISDFENTMVKELENLESHLFEATNQLYGFRIKDSSKLDTILFEIQEGSILTNEFEKDSSTAAIVTTPAENLPREFKNALKSAENYLSFMGISKGRLFDQLLYENYPEDAASYAVDNVNADWNEQALKVANNYLEYSAFSDDGLYQQLIYEQFTDEQAQYAIDHLD